MFFSLIQIIVTSREYFCQYYTVGNFKESRLLATRDSKKPLWRKVVHFSADATLTIYVSVSRLEVERSSMWELLQNYISNHRNAGACSRNSQDFSASAARLSNTAQYPMSDNNVAVPHQ